METQKLSFNLSAAELGQIDVLVAHGVFTSRTDVIRAGLRRIFDDYGDTMRQVVPANTGLGYFRITRAALEDAQRRHERQVHRVVGVLELSSDITPDLADATIEKITVFGIVRGPDAVLARIADRTHRGVSGQ